MNYMQVSKNIQHIVADANFIPREDMKRWQRIAGKLFALQTCLEFLGKSGKSVEAKVLVDFARDYSGLYPEIGYDIEEGKRLRLRFCKFFENETIDGVELRLEIDSTRLEYKVVKLSSLFGAVQISNLVWTPVL